MPILDADPAADVSEARSSHESGHVPSHGVIELSSSDEGDSFPFCELKVEDPDDGAVHFVANPDVAGADRPPSPVTSMEKAMFLGASQEPVAPTSEPAAGPASGVILLGDVVTDESTSRPAASSGQRVASTASAKLLGKRPIRSQVLSLGDPAYEISFWLS